MNQPNDREWIQTYTGRRFWPLAPWACDVAIDDIAHALSNLCRFTGHTTSFYSVAQHSAIASHFVPSADALWALLHDASEAYLTDIAKPLKEHPDFAHYKAAEERLMRVIAAVFSLPWPMPQSIKQIDQVMLATERRDVMGDRGLAWSVTAEPLSMRITPLSPRAAELLFLARFHQLWDERFMWLKSCKLIPALTNDIRLAV